MNWTQILQRGNTGLRPQGWLGQWSILQECEVWSFVDVKDTAIRAS